MGNELDHIGVGFRPRALVAVIENFWDDIGLGGDDPEMRGGLDLAKRGGVNVGESMRGRIRRRGGI